MQENEETRELIPHIKFCGMLTVLESVGFVFLKVKLHSVPKKLQLLLAFIYLLWAVVVILLWILERKEEEEVKE